MIEPVFYSTVLIRTFEGNKSLTNASGFLYRRKERLFLVTSNHVVIDHEANHFPTRVSIDFHTDTVDLTAYVSFSIPLYLNGKSVWRGGLDSAGIVDVAVIEIDQSALPGNAVFKAFNEANISSLNTPINIGSSLITLGYPMGFYDQLHRLPVARQASLASAYGVRFQGQGFFLVDAWTHRGLSGAPVLIRLEKSPENSDLPWYVLGIHSARLEAGSREPEHDEVLGLNAVWYADILKALTE